MISFWISVVPPKLDNRLHATVQARPVAAVGRAV
jgi:hypothetical protein